MWFSINTRFKLFGLLFVMLPLILLGVYLIILFQESLLERYQHEQQGILDTIVQNSIDERITYIERILDVYAGDPRLKAGLDDSESRQRIGLEWENLRKIIGGEYWFHMDYNSGLRLSVPAARGGEPRGSRTEHRDRAVHNILWSDARWSDRVNEVVITAYRAVYNDLGYPLGEMSIDSSVKGFFTSFKHEAFKKNALLLAVYPDSRVINFNRTPGELVEYDALFTELERSREQKRRKPVLIGGKSYYAFSVPIERLELQLVSLFPADKISDAIKPALLTMAVITAIALLITYFGLHMMTERIVITINRINAYMAEVTQGRFEAVLDVGGNDEMAVLNRYLVDMVSALKNIIHEKEQLVEMRTTLLHIISHNASTPLTLIFNNSMELLEEREPEADGSDAAELFLAAKNLKSLLENAMLYLKMQEGIKPEKLQRQDLKEVTAISCRMYEPLAREKGLEIVENYGGDLSLQTNYFLLKTIIENLIDNAVKYSRPGGVIRIGAFREGGIIRWEIVDNGPGFLQEELPDMYKKFTRLSAKPTSGENSSGLGLYLVKRLLDAMGGTIVLEERREGAGAHFILYFPVAGKPFLLESQR